MAPICQFSGCVVGGKQGHRFPTNQQLCNQWIIRSGDASLASMPPEKVRNRRICSNHFSNAQYMSDLRWRLRKDAVPDVGCNGPALGFVPSTAKTSFAAATDPADCQLLSNVSAAQDMVESAVSAAVPSPIDARKQLFASPKRTQGPAMKQAVEPLQPDSPPSMAQPCSPKIVDGLISMNTPPAKRIRPKRVVSLAESK